MALIIHRQWWLPALRDLFANEAQVRSGEIADAMGFDRLFKGDAVTRLRALGFPLKVAGFVPGSKLEKLYTMELPEGARLQMAKGRHRRRGDHDERQRAERLHYEQQVAAMLRSRFGALSSRWEQWAAEEAERLEETRKKIGYEVAPASRSVDLAPKRMISLEDE